MKKIAVTDLGEFWYADYKEPLQPFEAGYGFVGAVLKDDSGRLLCHYCGKTFEHLGRHAQAKHGISARDYKDETGLLQKSALVGERTRLGMSSRGNRSGKLNLLADADKRTFASRERTRRHGNGLVTPEHRNKTGRCYEQTLAVARSVVSSGEALTSKALARRGIPQSTVEMYFGTYDRLRAAVGAPSGYRRWRDAELIYALRSLADDLGRTPSTSDMRRYGLPDAGTYARHFGSLGAAQQKAGLDPNLPQPDGSDLDVSILVAYATHGHQEKAARQVGVRRERVMSVLHRFGFPFPSYGNAHNIDERRAWAADMARRLAGEEAAA